MARLTGPHVISVRDCRADAVPARYPTPVKVSAMASQVGRGVTIAIPNGMVTDRLGWEEIKNVVEQAFRDDEEVTCPDPLW
jgi:hypothetical protein